MREKSNSAIGQIMDKIYRSYGGHVVLRAGPGGSTFDVFILNDADESREVIAHFGPYIASSASEEGHR